MVIKNLASHRKRNEMTALIYSLSLGFLIFLSISCRMQISFGSHEELKKKGCSFLVTANEYEELNIPVLEEVLKANAHIIDEFSWVSDSIQNYKGSHIHDVHVDDMGNHMIFFQNVHGI